MMMDFTGKVILITGASSGIGLALVNEIAAYKCKLAILARRKNILDELAVNLKNQKAEILPIQCDVTKITDVKTSIKKIKDELGNIDIAILNAGTSKRILAENMSASTAQKIFDVNFMGMINFVTELLEDFKLQQKGMFVGISSLSDARGFPKSGLYCASKSAASTFLESLRVELLKYKIKVITVKPGFVKTPMTDKNEFYMPFMWTPEKAAKYILNGIQKEKKIIQFPWAIVWGARLIKLLPNFLFDYFASKHLESTNSQSGKK